MAIDITREQLYTLTGMTKVLPPIDGKRIAVTTLWRWCFNGARGVHLEYVRVGGRIVTSMEAFTRFVEARGCAANGQPSAQSGSAQLPTWYSTKPRSARQRELDRARANAILDQAGI